MSLGHKMTLTELSRSAKVLVPAPGLKSRSLLNRGKDRLWIKADPSNSRALVRFTPQLRVGGCHGPLRPSDAPGLPTQTDRRPHCFEQSGEFTLAIPESAYAWPSPDSEEKQERAIEAVNSLKATPTRRLEKRT
jgi:hypothetical protein